MARAESARAARSHTGTSRELFDQAIRRPSSVKKNAVEPSFNEPGVESGSCFSDRPALADEHASALAFAGPFPTLFSLPTQSSHINRASLSSTVFPTRPFFLPAPLFGSELPSAGFQGGRSGWVGA